MRLIDGDALEKAIYEWMPKDQETWMDSKIPPIENLVVSIMMTIQEQPTVDAIPIEWIEEWLLSCDVTYKRLAIESLLKDWKEEQEKENGRK